VSVWEGREFVCVGGKGSVRVSERVSERVVWTHAGSRATASLCVSE
jgi:hypothetical protein